MTLHLCCIALALAGFTIAFGTRHLDTTERHEGMVAAIAVESVVKLVAFLTIGAFVTWGLFAGPADIFARAAARVDLKPLLGLGAESRFAGGQWFALTLLNSRKRVADATAPEIIPEFIYK